MSASKARNFSEQILKGQVRENAPLRFGRCGFSTLSFVLKHALTLSVYCMAWLYIKLALALPSKLTPEWRSR